MNDVIIRSHCENDLEQIAAIEKECFSQPWSINSLKDFANGAFSRILTAESKSKIAGYITYTHIFEEIQIANVAVSGNFRRKGIATMLIQNLLNEGLKNGVEVITLEVRNSNLAAIHLYENNGFERVGIRKNYYSNPTEDAILMNYSYISRKE